MAQPRTTIRGAELYGRLQTLMFLRVLFVSLLLGASVVIQIRETRTYFGQIQTLHFLLLAAVYALTIVYVLLLKRARNLVRMAYWQLLLDTLFITLVIYATGGIDSIFSFLYILVIITACIILYRRGGLVTASSSSILYGVMLDLHYYGIIRPVGRLGLVPEDYQSSHIFFLILVNMAAFYLVAFLGSYLSEQNRKSRAALKEKQIDIDQLETINESIVNSINSGLVAVDGEGGIILFNPAAQEILGINAAMAIGRKVEDVLPFLEPYGKKGEAADPGFPKKATPFEDILLDKDGKRVNLRFSMSPLRLRRTRQEGFLLVFQDMTEIVRIEEEMKKVEDLALIGELAAGIAHEIRNPLASISGSIEMLMQSREEDNVNRRLMDIVLREITRLNHLVDDFLLFARPKKTKIERFDLNKLILESQELFKKSRHWKHHVKMENRFHEPIHVESDPEQIKQILWNLFLNACDAMPEGGTLFVETHLEDSADTATGLEPGVRIVVRDTGHGFDPQDLAKIFTPFFTTKEKGSGLGLAIVKRLVEGLEGTICGRNHQSGSAEIVITLPMRPKETRLGKEGPGPYVRRPDSPEPLET